MNAANEGVIRRAICKEKMAQGYAGQTRGPVKDPINSQASEFENCCKALLRTAELQREGLNRLLIPTRQSKPFMVTTAGENGVSLAVGSGGTLYTTIVSAKMDEGFLGILEYIGVDVQPSGGYDGVTWQLKIGAEVYTKLPSNIFRMSTLATPYHFPMAFGSNKTISLCALNSGTNAVDVTAILQGWMEPVSPGNFIG